MDVIVMQVLHPISLHFHHRCLSEFVTLLFREIHHVLWGQLDAPVREPGSRTAQGQQMRQGLTRTQ